MRQETTSDAAVRLNRLPLPNADHAKRNDTAYEGQVGSQDFIKRHPTQRQAKHNNGQRCKNQDCQVR